VIRGEEYKGSIVKTALCELLGIEYPIIAAPMGPDLAGPELVAAVSNAGGLGILQAQLAPPPLFRQEIQRIRELTDKPFGVNLILHFPADDQVAICVEERVPVLSFFWGDPTPYLERAHSAGIKVLQQVGSVGDAEGAVRGGVDVIIAQGVEAGGHVAGEISTFALVPRAVDAVAPRPVAAAGGIADGRGIVAALALGAQAAVLGTRFLASAECRAHPYYKQKLLSATEAEHGANNAIRIRLAKRSASDAAYAICRGMARKRSARSGIARRRTGDRSYRHLRPTNAAPTFHGISAKRRYNR